MRNEIKDKLTTLKIEAKETRKKKARDIITIITLGVVFYLIPYFDPQLNGFLFLLLLVFIFGGMYLLLNAFPRLVYPLKPPLRAFKKIINAIEILENSKSPIAYKEAYSCLKQAYEILDSILLDDLGWYENVNQIVEQFTENLELVVLPATKKAQIRTEDLEEIAMLL